MNKQTIENTLNLLAENIACDTESAYDPMLSDDGDTISQVLLARMDCDPSYHLINETLELAERLHEEAEAELKEAGVIDPYETHYEEITEYAGDIGYMVDYVKEYETFRFFWCAGDYFTRASWTFGLQGCDYTPEEILADFYEWVKAHK